jgi:Mg-chelatase subunit ChlD
MDLVFWYVFTASHQKKNVVIVVDESGSMSIPSGGFKNPNTTLRVVMAREAAITVLETLSPSDHVCTT